MTIIRSFTNEYGIEYLNTEIKVDTATEQEMTETTTTYDDNYTNDGVSVTTNVFYQMAYWASSQAEVDGKQRFLFKVLPEYLPEGATIPVSSWRFQRTSEYDGMTIKEAAEKHFRNFVFPEGQDPGQYNPETLV